MSTPTRLHRAVNRTKTYDLGHGLHLDADQIWESYVGSQSPGEWLRYMVDTSDSSIDAEVEAYLSSEPASGWLLENGHDEGAVDQALCDMLLQYRDDAGTGAEHTAADEPEAPAAPEVEDDEDEESDEEEPTVEAYVAVLSDQGWGDALTLAVAEFLIEEDLAPEDVEETKNFSGFDASGEYVSIAENGRNGKDWLITEDADTAESLAVAVVTQDLRDEPEIFNQDWLMHHIDVDRLRDDLKSDNLDARITDLQYQADHDLVGLAEEMSINLDPFHSKDSGEEDYDPDEVDEDALRAAVDDKLEAHAEEQVDEELKDPVEYLRDLGSTDLLKQYIDVDAAAKDAVAVDGTGHFLASYDSVQNDLPSGGCYFRHN